jgi:hypothetical protein
MITRKNKYILAINLDISDPKTALISVCGEVVDSEFQETTILGIKPGVE